MSIRLQTDKVSLELIVKTGVQSLSIVEEQYTNQLLLTGLYSSVGRSYSNGAVDYVYWGLAEY